MECGFEKGTIKLDSIRNVFYSGQIVTGSVNFTLDRPITVQALFVEATGEAVVEWIEKETETYNGVKQYKQVRYYGNEVYLRHTQHLVANNGQIQLPAGPQSLPFRFQIPHTAPSTAAGERGNVNYKITARLIQANNSTEELGTIFEVVAPFDLNLANDTVKQPINFELEETDAGCSCFCGSGEISVKITLPVTGYCPGQIIPISVQAQNRSGNEIKKIVYQLVVKECYRTKQPMAEYMPPERVLVSVKSGAVLGKTTRNFTVNLKVPDLIVPNLENCTIIDIGYFFKVKVKLSGCDDDLEDESEICLGLIPLIGFTQDEYKHPMAHSLPDGPIPDPLQAPVGINSGVIEPSNSPYTTSQVSHVQSSYPTQNVPYPAHNVPYLPQNVPYPPQNMPYPSHPPDQASTGRAPFCDYQIGFQGPQGTSHPAPYNMPQNYTPYPGPTPASTGYPLHVTMPQTSSPIQPSAPPPSS